RRDQGRDRAEPVAVEAQELGLRVGRRLFGLGLRTEDVPVDASAAHRPEAGAAADAPRLHERVARELVLGLDARAPGAVPAVARRLRAEQRLAHDRAKTVRADHEVALDGAAVGLDDAIRGTEDGRPEPHA